MNKTTMTKPSTTLLDERGGAPTAKSATAPSATVDPGPWGAAAAADGEFSAESTAESTAGLAATVSDKSVRREEPLREVFLGPLALIALTASFGVESEIHRHFFLATSIILLALAFRGAGSKTTKSTMKQHNDVTAPTKAAPSSSSHVLIEGTFDGLDAQEILLSMLNSKIDYHTRRTFGSMERFGEPDHGSERRLEKLKATRDAVRATLAQAIEGRQSVRIDSTVQITIEGRPVA